MAGIGHILIATDGSEGALKAAKFAGELARACNAAVSVLFVQSEDAIVHEAWGIGGTMSVDQIRDTFRRHAEESELPKTTAALGLVDGGVKSVFAWGHPAVEICRFADEQNVDVIVVGSHGRSGLTEAFLGSVSHTVANKATRPVTIVR